MGGLLFLVQQLGAAWTVIGTLAVDGRLLHLVQRGGAWAG